jgi:hypothetical protein
MYYQNSNKDSPVPSVALMYANSTPFALTWFQLTLGWYSETSIPRGDARLEGGAANAEEAERAKVNMIDLKCMVECGKSV